MTAVNAALTDLIAKAPVLGNAKLVHWYSSGISEEGGPASPSCWRASGMMGWILSLMMKRKNLPFRRRRL